MPSCCAAKKPMTTPDKPLVVGEPDGQVVRVRPTVNYRFLRVGVLAWVEGTGVNYLVESGIFGVVD